MNNQTIRQILHESAQLLNMDLDSSVLKSTDDLLRQYHMDELGEFIRDMTNVANATGIVFIKKEIEPKEFEVFVENFDSPMVLFLYENNTAIPAIVNTNSKNNKKITILYPDHNEVLNWEDLDESRILKNEAGELVFLSVFAYKSVVGSDMGEGEIEKLSPVQRLFRLLSADKRDILYVYIYALIIGVTSLILPLGIQAAIELISGGVFFSSVYFLITIIIIGVLGSGLLQVLQITIVE